MLNRLMRIPNWQEKWTDLPAPKEGDYRQLLLYKFRELPPLL